jgi:predicted porin
MTSLKKLIAVLAISLPLAASAQQAAAPAAAPAPLAQIYGTLNANIQNIGGVGATQGVAANVQNRLAVSLDSSNIGVKGTANVAGGFGVVYQCESSAKIDGTGTNSWCDRNSRVGLTHPVYGTIFLGNWDTPFKAAYYGTKADDPFGNTDVYGANNLMGSPGFKTLSGGTRGFDIRATNSVVYWTPKLMGLSGRVQYQVPENATAKFYGTPQPAGPATNTQLAPQLFAAGVNYDQGPLSVVVAYELHRDYSGTTGGGLAGFAPLPAGMGTAPNAAQASRDQAIRAAAGYEFSTPFGVTTPAVVWEYLEYTARTNGAAVGVLSEFKRPALGVSLKHRYGDHEIRGRFNWADKGTCRRQGILCQTSGVDAHEVAVGYAYYLAASTQVYAFWTKIVNDKNALYVPGAGGGLSGAPAVVSPANAQVGFDPQAYGVGIRYAF